MAQLKLMKKEWFDWFKNTTLDNITAWTEYYYINPDSQHWISNYQLWDEEWELGSINDTGDNVEDSTRIRSKNYIEVSPNTPTCFSWQVSKTNAVRIFFYDINKNFISYLQVNITYNTKAIFPFTTPNGCYYIRFRTAGSYSVTTYSNNICINKFNSTFNGNYEPRIIKIEDILGVVNLSTLNWTYTNNRFRASIDDVYVPPSDEIPKTFISNDYTPRESIIEFDTVDDSYTVLFYNSIRYLLVKDSSYTNVNTFVQSLNDVYLVYLKKDSPLGR